MQSRRETQHHTVVVVDVEGFGDRGRTNLHQRAVRDGLYQVVEKAFGTAGVHWDRCYHEDRGDALFILAPGSVDKAVFVETVPPLLVTALRVHNDTHPDAQRIRLRMALHAGEVHYDEHGVTSSSLTLAFRLNEAPPLKAALAASPGVLALITSNWFFEDVVRHTPGAAPATWRPVEVTVKETTTTGWITLPDHPYPPGPVVMTSWSPPAVRSADRGGAAVPRQLPSAVRDFTGRAEHLAALDTQLPSQSDAGDGRASAVVISAVDGTAGIGKTALALFWAHRVQHRFPDGTLHVNLRGYGPGAPATPGEVLEQFLRTLDVPPQRIPADVEGQSALFRSSMAGRRMLLVLDNANHPDQIRPLLPGAAGCMVLATSRASLTGLVVTEAAYRLTLDLLTSPEAHNLVTSVIGAGRAAAEPGAVDELVRLCARLPLALRIAASRIATHPHTTVADIVSELADDHARLDALSHGGDERAAVRAVFDWSYRRLPAEQARLFRRLGLHAGPEMSVQVAAATAGLDLPVARRLLDALADSHLIESVARDRYRFHDLLHAYAAERAEHDDAAEDRDHVHRTLLEWYAHHGREAHRVILSDSADWHAAAAVDTHARPEITFSGPDDAWTWVTFETANVIATLRAAAPYGSSQLVMLLADISVGPLLLGARWADAFDACRLGLATARRIGDRTSEYHLLQRLGMTHRNVAQWQEAVDAFQEALVLARELGDPWLQAENLGQLGLTCAERGEYAEAGEYLRAALPLSPGAQQGNLESHIEFTLSAVCTGLGDYEEALRHAERSLELLRQSGSRDVEAYVLHHMAKAKQGLGAHAEAIELCERALIIETRHRDPRNHAFILDTLGTSLAYIGETARAIAYWREALAILDEFGYHSAPELRARLHALETGGSGQGL
ncbi:tetratricopeptide repeat protein [Amycolatopsis sp. NBC_00345]|uniref:ATP-binding protein n=1 Tax=Amycolatopsis sp. NBC_00345 TaxID=2975955 RepID=UPI002E267359